MTDDSKQVQLDQLRISLQVLEAQRALPGAAIEPVMEAVHRQIATLEAELATAAPADERRIVTILFSDIVGSTAPSLYRAAHPATPFPHGNTRSRRD